MRTKTAVAVLVVTCLSLAGGLSPASAQATKKRVPGISNFTQVDAAFACGGATSPDAAAALKEQGFASVVNLRLATEPGANVDAEQGAVEKVGMKYVHIPFNSASPDPAVIEAFLKAVADAANQPLFVHCASANRAGALWLVKRVMIDGWTRERAEEEATVIGLTSPPLKQFALDYLAKQGK